MASITEAYDSVNKTANRNDPYENPQSFQRLRSEAEHPHTARHMLGLVGGNEVSLTKSNWPDVESDLKGITRPNTDCAARKHLPFSGDLVVRKNPKNNFAIDTSKDHLPAAQMWAYPVVIGPKPLVTEVCVRPEKY
jgi:hypothetical protein